MEKFAIGFIVGGLAGALLITNNYKMRALVRKGQQEAQERLDAMLDEKLRCLDESDTENTPIKKQAKKATD